MAEEKYSILDTFDPEVNFWEVHPQLKIPKPFADLYKADKTKGKSKSSNLMWAIAYVYHPKSKFYNLPLEQKQRIVAKDFLKDKNFDWSSIDDEIKLFKELCMTPAERSLDNFYRKLLERDQFINTHPYDFEMITSSKTRAEVLDAMLSKTNSLYQTYSQILDQLYKEDADSKTEGGAVESASDAGEI